MKLIVLHPIAIRGQCKKLLNGHRRRATGQRLDQHVIFFIDVLEDKRRLVVFKQCQRGIQPGLHSPASRQVVGARDERGKRLPLRGHCTYRAAP